jgi:hypothetical protein
VAPFGAAHFHSLSLHRHAGDRGFPAGSTDHERCRGGGPRYRNLRFKQAQNPFCDRGFSVGRLHRLNLAVDHDPTAGGGDFFAQLCRYAHPLFLRHQPGLRPERIADHDGQIFAAICVYLLLGYAWTFAYAIVEELDPGSFVALSNTPREYVDRVLEMRHFSFMTLTTVGYGDIVPRSSAARTLAGIEAITGQIYLTVLVARLVGLHIVHGQTRRAGED